MDVFFRINDDFLLVVDSYHPRVAIWLCYVQSSSGNSPGALVGTYVARMVDKSSEVALFCGIDDAVLVNPEHVAAADAPAFVPLLSHISDFISDHLAFVVKAVKLSALTRG